MKTMHDDQKNRIALNKLEVSRRQIETAIQLYFNGGDPVSTHTLTTAALEVLSGLNDACKDSPMLSDLEASGVIRPNTIDVARRAFRKAQNFFKHADKDPGEILDFNPDATAFYLIDAVEKYRELSKKHPPVMRVFALWFRVQWTDVVRFANGEERFLRIARSLYPLDDKEKFYATFLPLYVAEESKASTK